MVDTHAHAPQFVNAGNGLDMPLLEWLETYTFPAETRFKDADYAKKSALPLVSANLFIYLYIYIYIYLFFCYYFSYFLYSLHRGGAPIARPGHHNHQLLRHHPRARHQGSRRYRRTPARVPFAGDRCR